MEALLLLALRLMLIHRQVVSTRHRINCKLQMASMTLSYFSVALVSEKIRKHLHKVTSEPVNEK